MSQDFTSTGLVATIKRRATLPTSQNLFTTDDLLAIANDEMQSNIVPLIMSVQEEYFVTFKDFIVAADPSSPTKIPIPSDAVAGKLRDVCWVDNIGTLMSLPRVSLEEISSNVLYSQIGGLYSQIGGFYIQDNNIILYPNASRGTGTIRLFYMKRPLYLSNTTKSCKIKSINSLTNEILVDKIPNTWLVGDSLNVISNFQPFNLITSSITITAVSDPTLTVSDVTGLSVGQYISQYGECPIPQLPVEAHAVLAQAVAVKCLEALGDAQNMQIAEAKLKQNKEDLLKIINPRVDGAAKKIVSSGILEYSRSTVRRFW